jgi:adenine-specific DNA-methyltransferase
MLLLESVFPLRSKVAATCRWQSPLEFVSPNRMQLVQIPHLSHGSAATDNLLVQGDNRSVLRAIASEYRKRVRCVYIDPPYNNRERYLHYSDALSHEAWLGEIKATLALLPSLLRDDGSLWISIDDNELHYLKVLADEVLGRDRFVTTIVWEHRTTRENRRAFSNNHEYILVYAANPRRFRESRNLVPAGPTLRARYKNPDNDPRGPWQSVSVNAQAGHATEAQFYELAAPNGKRHLPPKGRCWLYTEARMTQAIADGEVWFGRDGNGVPRLKRFLTSSTLCVTPETLWTADIAGTTRSAKKHLLDIFPDDAVFDTPKPESLLKRILQIATDTGDLVLDAYLGSGTTAAVAHKMGRSYIGIEVGRQAVTHCAERLRKVVDGDETGISSEVGWCGGGGFRFMRATERAAARAA